MMKCSLLDAIPILQKLIIVTVRPSVDFNTMLHANLYLYKLFLDFRSNLFHRWHVYAINKKAQCVLCKLDAITCCSGMEKGHGELNKRDML